MLSIEKIKQVAEYIWQSVSHEIFENEEGLIIETNLGFFDFDPIDDDADTMMVFKALVDECKKRQFEITINEGSLDVAYEKSGFIYSLFEDEFNNENICLAYLSVMGE